MGETSRRHSKHFKLFSYKTSQGEEIKLSGGRFKRKWNVGSPRSALEEHEKAYFKRTLEFRDKKMERCM